MITCSARSALCLALVAAGGCSPEQRLFYAVEKEDLGEVKRLIAAGADVNAERPARISCVGTGRWTDPEHAMDDTVLLLCKTASEKLIRIRVDMLSKRPHAMANYTLQGTKGAYESARREGEGNWVWLADYCGDSDQWLPLESFEDEFLPEVWRDPPAAAREAGHGGGDYFVVMDFVDAVKGLKPPETGIHEALDMTLPGLVSQESIRCDGEWLDVPDSRDWLVTD